MINPVSVKEPIIINQGFIVPYTYAAGEAGSRFCREIRDNKRIMGIRCNRCSIVLVPPQTTCGKCFSKLEEWVEVKTTGTLLTYTVVHYSLPVHPAKAPLAYGIIRLDGADTGLVHMLAEGDPRSLRVGMRVRAVFREKRQGNILDIKYFEPM